MQRGQVGYTAREFGYTTPCVRPAGETELIYAVEVGAQFGGRTVARKLE